MFVCVSAQRMSDAETFFNQGHYREAGSIYAQALKKTPKDGGLNFKYARCLYEQGQVTEATLYFEQAALFGFAKANRFLGDIYFADYRFQEAAQAYDAWLASDKFSRSTRTRCSRDRSRWLKKPSLKVVALEAIVRLVDEAVRRPGLRARLLRSLHAHPAARTQRARFLRRQWTRSNEFFVRDGTGASSRSG